MTRLVPAADAAPADWIVDALQTFGESAHSIVPACFSSYLRIFHPAARTEEGGELRPVRWDEIALANGTTANPAMQFPAITRDSRFVHESQPGIYDDPPSEGSAPAEVVGALVTVLARHTTSPQRCWFAWWDGFGYMRADFTGAAEFRLPGREYHLLGGPIEAAIESALPQSYTNQSPNIWWPDDRTWCVATEIDFNTTYVGCSDACRDDILAEPTLEASAIDPQTGIDWRSDPLNPYPDE